MANVPAYPVLHYASGIGDDNEKPYKFFWSDIEALCAQPDNVWRAEMTRKFDEYAGEGFYERYYLTARARYEKEAIMVKKLKYFKEGFDKLDVTPKSALENEAQILCSDIRHAEICLKETEGRNEVMKRKVEEMRVDVENTKKDLDAKVESNKVKRENARKEAEEAMEANETGARGRRGRKPQKIRKLDDIYGT